MFAYLYLLLTPLFWSGNFILARAMHAELPPIMLSFSRWSLALCILLPFLVPKFSQQWPLLKKHWKIVVFSGLVGVMGFNTQIYTGLQTTMATNATLLQSLIPVVILLLSAAFLKETVSGKQWVGVSLSFFGALILLSHGDISTLTKLQSNSGDLWILGAVTVWAVYSIGLRWKPVELDGLFFLGGAIAVAIIGLIFLIPLEIDEIQQIEWTLPVFGTILYMAIFPSILAYLFWNQGVSILGAPRAGLFIHLMPVYGLILAAVFLGEKIERFHLVGVALIFAGIYLAVISGTIRLIRKQQRQDGV